MWLQLTLAWKRHRWLIVGGNSPREIFALTKKKADKYSYNGDL